MELLARRQRGLRHSDPAITQPRGGRPACHPGQPAAGPPACRPHPTRGRRLAAITLVLLFAASLAPADVRTVLDASAPAGTPAPVAGLQPDPVIDPRVAVGRRALDAGDAARAIAIADEILAKVPASRPAAALKIDALVVHSPDWKPALETYERWAAARKAEDRAMLEPIARAVLREIGGQQPALATEALAQLACVGDRKATAAIRDGEPVKDPPVDVLVARARLGDAAALTALTRLADAPSGGSRMVALRALGTLDEAAAEPRLKRALADRDPATRLQATELARSTPGLGVSKELQGLLADPILLVRIQAAAALLAAGDRSGEPLLLQALNSDFTDARLAAARGLAAGSNPAWRPAARALLENPDGDFRIQAAALLLEGEPLAALPVLRKAATDPNPVVRTAVARALAVHPGADLPLLRTRLNDPSPAVRLEAARALAGVPNKCEG